MNEITKSDFFETGKDGVRKILTPDDKKIDIVEFDDKKLCCVKSGMGYPAIYPMYKTHFEPKAEAILMDLAARACIAKAFGCGLLSAQLQDFWEITISKGKQRMSRLFRVTVYRSICSI